MPLDNLGPGATRGPYTSEWYDTTNGDVLLNPSETTPSQDNCWFVSAVDNGWYASGLIEVREALPELRGLVDRLMEPRAL